MENIRASNFPLRILYTDQSYSTTQPTPHSNQEYTADSTHIAQISLLNNEVARLSNICSNMLQGNQLLAKLLLGSAFQLYVGARMINNSDMDDEQYWTVLSMMDEASTALNWAKAYGWDLPFEQAFDFKMFHGVVTMESARNLSKSFEIYYPEICNLYMQAAERILDLLEFSQKSPEKKPSILSTLSKIHELHGHYLLKTKKPEDAIYQFNRYLNICHQMAELKVELPCGIDLVKVYTKLLEAYKQSGYREGYNECADMLLILSGSDKRLSFFYDGSSSFNKRHKCSKKKLF